MTTGMEIDIPSNMLYLMPTIGILMTTTGPLLVFSFISEEAADVPGRNRCYSMEKLFGPMLGIQNTCKFAAVWVAVLLLFVNLCWIPRPKAQALSFLAATTMVFTLIVCAVYEITVERPFGLTVIIATIMSANLFYRFPTVKQFWKIIAVFSFICCVVCVLSSVKIASAKSDFDSGITIWGMIDNAVTHDYATWPVDDDYPYGINVTKWSDDANAEVVAAVELPRNGVAAFIMVVGFGAVLGTYEFGGDDEKSEESEASTGSSLGEPLAKHE